MKFSKFNFTTCAISNADPCFVTSIAHELYEDDTIMLETTGTLPTGLSEDTTYYVILDGITADTFQISATRRGDAIATTSAGSGTHSFIKTNRANLEPFIQDNC